MVILEHIYAILSRFRFLSQFTLFCVNFWGLKLRSRIFFDKCDVWTQALFPNHCWSWKLKFISFDFLKFHQCEVFTSESSTANNIKANLRRAFCCCSNKLMKQYFCRFWRLRPSAALPLLALTSSNFSAIDGDAVRIAMHCQTQQYNNKALPTRLHSTT